MSGFSGMKIPPITPGGTGMGSLLKSVYGPAFSGKLPGYKWNQASNEYVPDGNPDPIKDVTNGPNTTQIGLPPTPSQESSPYSDEGANRPSAADQASGDYSRPAFTGSPQQSQSPIASPAGASSGQPYALPSDVDPTKIPSPNEGATNFNSQKAAADARMTGSETDKQTKILSAAAQAQQGFETPEQRDTLSGDDFKALKENAQRGWMTSADAIAGGANPSVQANNPLVTHTAPTQEGAVADQAYNPGMATPAEGVRQSLREMGVDLAHNENTKTINELVDSAPALYKSYEIATVLDGSTPSPEGWRDYLHTTLAGGQVPTQKLMDAARNAPEAIRRAATAQGNPLTNPNLQQNTAYNDLAAVGNDSTGNATINLLAGLAGPTAQKRKVGGKFTQALNERASQGYNQARNSALTPDQLNATDPYANLFNRLGRR